ncbi:MAG: hypothetical protein IJ728_04235 [Selenomonadaceae bacterium]|nr:hypothetical protein [Selenomonadaceae bacterium]
MKISIRRISILLIFGILFSFNSFTFANWKDLQVVNTCGDDIYGFYLIQSGRHPYWGTNLLTRPLRLGQTAYVRYEDMYSNFNVKIVCYDKVYKWVGDNGFNLSGAKAWRMTIYYAGNDSDGGKIFGIRIN